MSDYERYGDYNGANDDDDKLYPPPKWVLFLKRTIVVLSILIAVCVIGLLAVRMIYATWYPDSMKQLFPTDALRTAYADGTLEAKTQELIFPYEDRKNGYFHADNMIFVEESGSLQCSVRINRAIYNDIKKNSGVSELPTEPSERFDFTLYYFFENGDEAVYRPSEVKTESHFLYDYYKICFDGVTFEQIPWYRLNIHVAGAVDTEKEPFGCIVLYQNDEEYSTFTPFALTGKEFSDD